MNENSCRCGLEDKTTEDMITIVQELFKQQTELDEAGQNQYVVYDRNRSKFLTSQYGLSSTNYVSNCTPTPTTIGDYDIIVLETTSGHIFLVTLTTYKKLSQQ